ncbi:restriction endonuclease subunit S [Cyanobium sp. NIES-981]|uniref:restriction endonuclease subunit S n=1 Tax=Cyanobium sp. NIES-981 TaxID=1851505 RepID=UPI000B3649E2|nr:restriction endonuclease subunit S [Cyanobium sp. NIES-981]
MREGWQFKRLVDVATLQRGFDLPTHERLGGDVPLVTSSGISDMVDSSAVIGPGVATGRSGSIGKVFFLDQDFWPLNTVLYVKDFHGNDQRFIFYLLQNLDLSRFATGTGVPTLNRNFVHDEVVCVPPLPEQQRIAALLDEAFAGLATAKANAERNLRNARAIFESHLQSVFSQRGEAWVEKCLDELCTFSSGGTPSKANKSYWEGEIPWVSGRDMKSTRLSDSALHISQAAVAESATRMASVGTLLILVRGMGLAHGAQITELLVPCAFNQDIRGIHAKPGLLPRYLLFALRDGINSSDTVLSSAAHGTLKIDSNELAKVIIPFPPLEQQQSIVSAIDTLAEETQRLTRLYERKLAALEELKKSLLHQAFNGEL